MEIIYDYVYSFDPLGFQVQSFAQRLTSINLGHEIKLCFPIRNLRNLIKLMFTLMGLIIWYLLIGMLKY